MNFPPRAGRYLTAAGIALALHVVSCGLLFAGFRPVPRDRTCGCQRLTVAP